MTPPVTTEALVEALQDLVSAFEVGEDGTVSVAPGRIASVALLNAQGVLDDTHIGPLAEKISDLELSVNGLEAAHQQVTAERDADRAEHARYRASAEEMWETAKRHGGQMLAEKRRADVAEAALATANAELARLRAEGEAILASQRYWSGEASRAADELVAARAELAEVEADLEACAQHCEGYAALNADEATARGKLLGQEKASRDEKCAALWATHHAANEMAGFIRARFKRRTALARAATAREGA